MSDEPLADSDVDTVVAGARTFLGVDDHQRAYELLQPLYDAGGLEGEPHGTVSFLLGEACLGLDGLDAAVHYFEESLQSGPADERTEP